MFNYSKLTHSLDNDTSISLTRHTVRDVITATELPFEYKKFDIFLPMMAFKDCRGPESFTRCLLSHRDIPAATVPGMPSGCVHDPPRSAGVTDWSQQAVCPDTSLAVIHVTHLQ
ncbi:hypothetical protein ACOMHN_047319 [Nucella lapillus]